MNFWLCLGAFAAFVAASFILFLGSRGVLKRCRDVEGRIDAAEARMTKRISQFNDELRK